MDSARLIINNQDRSITNSPATETAVTGYTVIKAPKGPIKPIKVSSIAELHRNFGKVSKQYPNILEAEQFVNSPAGGGGYSLYVSAPYDPGTTSIPVAYVTSKGVFSGAKNVKLTKDFEKILEGDRSVVIDNLTRINNTSIAPLKVLRDIRYPKSTGFIDLESYADPELIEKVVDVPDSRFTARIVKDGKASIVIPLGIPQTSTGAFANSTTPLIIRLYNLPFKVYKKEEISPASEEAQPTYVETSYIDLECRMKAGVDAEAYQSGKVYLNGDPSDTCGSISVETLGDVTQYVLHLEGTATGQHNFTQASIKQSLDAKQLEAIEAFYVDRIHKSETVNATIFPKYPGEHKINIKFNPLLKEEVELDEVVEPTTVVTTLEDSEAGTAVPPKIEPKPVKVIRNTEFSRNRLDMSIVEEGFATEVVNVVGTLAPKLSKLEAAKGITKTVQGFTESNLSYSTQSCIAVYPLTVHPTADDPSAILASDMENCLDSYLPVCLRDGKRGWNETTRNQGWEKAKDDKYSDVAVFFSTQINKVTIDNYDTCTISSDESTFLELADPDIHPQSTYIFNLTVPSDLLEDLDKPGTGKSSEALARLEFGRNYNNINNVNYVTLNNFNEDVIASPLTGAWAYMQAKIIDNAYGGAAPMFINRNGLGGEILKHANVLRQSLAYNYTKKQQALLDRKNFNPVIEDDTYGIMVTGQKTCKPGELTDWSYIGHVNAFLAFQRTVKNEVMIPQLGKANNDYYRTLRGNKVSEILRKRISGTNPIWAEGIVDTSTAEGVNDATNRAAKKFVIDVKVKVYPYSEYVELNFTNVDQSTNLEG